MITYPADGLEGFGLEKQQRIERLKWVFYGIGAMLFVVGGFYMQERVELGVLHAYILTVLTYGALIYVEELEHLRRLWLWKGVLATVPLHIMFVAGLLWWDANGPLSPGYILVYRVWPFFVAEMVVFTLIIDHLKASATPDEPRRILTRFLNWTNKPKRETRKIITMPDVASNPIVFLFVIWVAGWVERRLMDQITDDYRPWGAPSESVE